MVEELLATAVEFIGGTPRPNQVTMANAVEHALESQRHLAVQAGTGTGKSLAYLVPAIDHAMKSDSPVVITTATLALQRQLMTRDVPRVVESLKDQYERSPRFAILKGKNNYVCKRKTQGMLEPWLSTTETGDRDEFGGTDEEWRELSVTSRECIGAARCPFGDECFSEIAKHQAEKADIIITNHAMLAIDAAADFDLIPEHEVVIIDEAHELESRVTSASTLTLSSNILYSLAAQLNKIGEARGEATLMELADTWRENPLTTGRWVDPNPADQRFLKELSDALISIHSSLGHGNNNDDVEAVAERDSVRSQINDALAALDDLPDSMVIWVTEEQTYCAAPLSIQHILRDALFTDKTAVLTSATLAIGGNFNSVAKAWGIPDNTWDGLDVGTPFDPARAGILYIPEALDPPGKNGISDQALEEIEELITAMGGRTLGLFTSRKAAETAAEYMRDKLDMPIYCQGDAHLPDLIKKFQEKETSCLFGTLTLWQGVDVPGPSCSLVIMDRIPFPRPDDPLMTARKDEMGFMAAYCVPAAILLAQGAGRLIRSTTDKGVVALLDPRVKTARYGSFLLQSLPPFWQTRNHETTIGALGRLRAELEKAED
ncbi:MAG: ATP-dependent DNA helicase [Corynebacterium sp.]|nr:ATP-dependent DNA helicase [Corynebacterium sp.]